MSRLARLCPKCRSFRGLAEVVCEHPAHDGQACGFSLINVRPAVPVRPSDMVAQVPTPVLEEDTFSVEPTTSSILCPNGHSNEPGDVQCLTCGDLLGAETNVSPATEAFDGWSILDRLGLDHDEVDVFRVRHDETGQLGLLRWFAHGVEPRARTYRVLQPLAHPSLAKLLAFGRLDERPWEVWDQTDGPSLSSIVEQGRLSGAPLIDVVRQLASSLDALEAASLRHGGLVPCAIRFRGGDFAQLELGDLSTARLAEFDLEAAGGGRLTRYASPEAVVGAQSVASDWWSLGIILAELLTRGRFFEGVNDRAFLLHVITRGVDIPEGIDSNFALLLRGLLTRDHARRWRGAEVSRWLCGERTIQEFYEGGRDAQGAGIAITIGGRPVRTAEAFALAAASAETWDEALQLVETGAVATWLTEVGAQHAAAELKSIMDERAIEIDARFALALLALNSHLPLVVRGDIKTPNRLLEEAQSADVWFQRPVVTILRRLKREPWLVRLTERAGRVEARAEELGLPLVRDRFKVTRLAVFEARLESFWRARRNMFPDARVPGLAALLERRTLTDEDLILLICADDSAFRPAKEVLDEAERLCREIGAFIFQRAEGTAALETPKRQLIESLSERLGAFKRCGLETLDAWADALRLGRRLPLAQLLVLLASDRDLWAEPPHQDYLRNILQFMQKKILLGVQRGPLIKLMVGRSATRIDLVDLGAGELTERILARALKRDEQPISLTLPGGRSDERLAKLKRIAKASDLHRRETGVSALVLAWPLVGFEDRSLSGAASLRLAPVVLWPIRIRNAQGVVSIAFDPERDPELNPALEKLLGEDLCVRWREHLEPLIRGEIQDVHEVRQAFEALADLPADMKLGMVPDPASFKGKARPGLVSAGAVMLADFPSQAIVEDLRNILGRPMAGSSLEVLLRLADTQSSGPSMRPGEADRFSIFDADPSQEEAVLAARLAPGLKLEGPPGTGKSQTIVNIITDSIGRGQSVMLVCEKQAALEVVHKRLRAEGLGHRVVRIEDTQSDRKRLLTELQSQIPNVVAAPRDHLSQLRTRRAEAAAMIDRLEAQLTDYHEAVYAPSPLLGLSYRHVVSRIAALERETHGLTAPELRPVLGSLSPSALEQVVGECLGLTDTWYEADLSDTSLSIFKVFSTDTELEARLSVGLAKLNAAEEARRQSIDALQSATGLASEVSGQELRTWLREAGARLRPVPDRGRKWVARRKEQLATDASSRSQALVSREALTDIVGRLREAVPTAEEQAQYETIAGADQDVLLDLQTALPRFSLRRPFLDALNPVAAFSRNRARRLLRALGLAETRSAAATACRAADKELTLRRARQEYEDIARWLDLREEAATLSAEELRHRAGRLLNVLDQAIRLSEDVSSCPWPDPLWHAMLGAPEVWNEAFVRLEAAADLADSSASAAACLADLSQWIVDAWLAKRRDEIGRHETIAVDFGVLLAALTRLRAYQSFRQSALGPQASAVFQALAPQRARLDPIEGDGRQRAVGALVRREAAQQWTQQLRAASPALMSPPQKVSGDIERLSSSDLAMRDINKKTLSHIDPAGISGVQAWSSIWQISGIRARRLRQVFDEGRDVGLLNARPIWLVNPDVASRVFPLEPGLFDVVIFDEASQMRVENAVPALYRAKRAIISGDSKQLPPTAFFGSAVSDDDDDDDLLLSETLGEDADAENTHRERRETALNRRHVKDCPDLLALSQGVLPERSLTIHYRSAYRELIDFSNAAFYNGSLNIPVNHPVAEVRRQKPIEVRRVDGVYANQSNSDEADGVVDCLAELWSREGVSPPTVGVVTFNLKQAELIEDRLQRRAEKDRGFKAALDREQVRQADGEDVSFFVRNLENVQGDERDHIIFSTTFGKDTQGRFKRSFGALTQTGGERRLNVAVTRAKEKVTVLTSMPTADISDFIGQQRGPAKARDFLQAYMQYAELLTAGEHEAARAQLGAFEVTPLPEQENVWDDSEDAMVTSVLDILEGAGHAAEVRPLQGAFAVDIAIIHPKTGLYCLGVELDGPRHPVLNSAKARDIWRPKLLKRQGMQLHRVLSAAWAAEPERERQRLLRAAMLATE